MATPVRSPGSKSGLLRRALACGLVTGLPAAAVLPAAAQLGYSTPGSVYLQDFSSLPTDAPNNANIQTGVGSYSSGWQDDTTTQAGTRISLPGWYLYHALNPGAESGFNNHQRLRMGSGSSNTGSFYGFALGGSTDSEKALGTLPSNTLAVLGDPLHMGLRLINNSGTTLTSFTVSYDGEQWRNGGSGNAHSLTFAYSFDATTADWATTNTTATYVSVSGLTFTSPIVGTTAATIDGNNAGRVANITSTITGVNWAPGTDLWLRWSDINDAGSDDGLAIDNVRFAAVPEPSTLVLGSLGLLALLRLRRQDR